MSRKLEIDYETADRITLCVLSEQLEYVLKEKQWFEADEDARAELEKEWGHSMYVHPEDYVNVIKKYIPSLETLIEYFGGTHE